MRTAKLSKGIAGLALGSLLLIGAGCGAASQSSINASTGDPRTGTTTRDRQGEPDYAPDNGGADVNAGVKLNLETTGAKDARRQETSDAAPAIDEAGAREIKVTATEFAFTPNEIRAKAGEKIKLTLVNSDGRHGIAIPAFNVSLKPPVGTSGSTVFIADKAGSYPFFCNVMCGSGHRSMKGTLVVE
ncbi:MAG TPA: cupredoxin domain-containing protein [Candidatus Eisenbacteria bacterium]|nr:cupredoxin domain-containing protein [Candidatus Eisenbacteria bacterium]